MLKCVTKVTLRYQFTQGHALTADEVVDFYSDIFKIEYPLPKIDLIAVHEFSHNAMEVRWASFTQIVLSMMFTKMLELGPYYLSNHCHPIRSREV